MFKNYFKIAIRQLRKQKMYSVIKDRRLCPEYRCLFINRFVY